MSAAAFDAGQGFLKLPAAHRQFMRAVVGNARQVGLKSESRRNKDAGFVFDLPLERLHSGLVKLKGLSRLEPQQPS
jgi:hypothetical protein